MWSGSEPPIYVVDASSWISIDGHSAANRILSNLSGLIEQGRIRMPVEVWKEIKDCGYVGDWVAQNKAAVVDMKVRTNVEYLRLVGKVTSEFPGMVGVRGVKNRADPYIVAYAAVKNITSNPAPHVVVCSETTNRRKNRKLPTACQKFGVKTMTLLDALATEYPNDWP